MYVCGGRGLVCPEFYIKTDVPNINYFHCFARIREDISPLSQEPSHLSCMPLYSVMFYVFSANNVYTIISVNPERDVAQR